MAQGFTNGLPYPLPVTKGGTGLVGTTINQILWSSAANTIAGLATANSSVLITSAGGVPSLATTLPSGISATNMNLTTPTLGVATATSLQCPTFLDSNGNTAFTLGSIASAVNYFTLNNSGTLAAINLNANGSDTNISMGLNAKGDGAFSFSNTTAANLLLLVPSLTTVAPAIQVLGSDSNISLTLTPKGTGSVVMPKLTFSPTTGGIVGTTAADNTDAGNVGQMLSSVNATSVAMTTATVTQIQTLSLTAGDWDVWATFYTTVNGATTQSLIFCQLHTSTATIAAPTTAQLASCAGHYGTVTTGNPVYLSTGQSRWNVSGATTVYLNAKATYGTNTLTGNGMIHARRRR